MKRNSVSLIAALAIAAAGASAQADLVNLARSASGYGITGNPALYWGTPAGIADGSLIKWNDINNIKTSPYRTGAASIAPYMTWSTAQDVRIVRVWSDQVGTLTTYDQIRIDKLKAGGNPTVETDWEQCYDSGTGLNLAFADIDLGATHNTAGLRVRLDRTTSGVYAGEIAVFGPQGPAGAGNLASTRVAPTATTSSSSYYTPSSATDQDWYYTSLWVSGTPDGNPGTQFHLTQSFTDATINAAAITWQGLISGSNYRCVPTSWKLQYSTDNGATFSDIGTYTRDGQMTGNAPVQFYYNFPELTGVDRLRILVDESALDIAGGSSSTWRLGVWEFEAFNVAIPEPASAAALAGAAIVLLARRRR